MLKNDFYKIKSLEVVADQSAIKAQIKLNRDHNIFNGHFPEIPVVPGVCTVQMIKEIIEEVVAKELMLVKGDNIKLHNPINPDHNLFLNIDISVNKVENIFQVRSEIYFEKLKFCSFRGEFKACN